jgi:2,5-dioxopentanoate dehydrogenase
MSQVQPILINGEWVASKATRTFRAVNPATKEEHHIEFPVSPWEECDAACQAAHEASVQMRGWPGDRFGAFLDAFADRIEKRAEELITTANLETGYPIVPRLQDVELPRTINQMRQGANAARDGSWCNAVIDTAAGIRSMLGPGGPVCVFGPNNFPFAFNGAAGGDFVAAVAAGNPVIAKGHSSHPRTTQIFAEEALKAARETGMPKAMIREARRFARPPRARFLSELAPFSPACFAQLTLGRRWSGGVSYRQSWFTALRTKTATSWSRTRFSPVPATLVRSHDPR